VDTRVGLSRGTYLRKLRFDHRGGQNQHEEQEGRFSSRVLGVCMDVVGNRGEPNLWRSTSLLRSDHSMLLPAVVG